MEPQRRSASVSVRPMPGHVPAPSASRLGRDFRFLLGVLALCVVTALILQAVGSAAQRRTTSTGGATPTVAVTATQAPSQAVSSSVVAAQVHAYTLPTPNAGLMQPAMDAQGNLWFGEMTTNLLARLNAKTGAVTTWQPPNGQYSIMQTAVAKDGTIWFTEQAANYIGRFDPTTERFTTYPLEQVNGHSSTPQDLVFDAAGNLWFTEITAAKIGRLNTLTGAITTWPVPAPAPGQRPAPYSLALTPDGQVWFGHLGGGGIGRLNPATGDVQTLRLASTGTLVFSMTADTRGRIWFTELEDGKIGMADPATGRVTEIAVPKPLGTSAGLYAILAGADGAVWFASAGENALIKYVPNKASFTFYSLPQPNSVPFGLALDGSGTLWFTAGGPSSYVGAMRT